MKPYYEHAGITIYHGDARDLVDACSADAFVTDPPYGINGGAGCNERHGKGIYSGAFEDTPLYVETTVVPVVASLIRKMRGAITPGVGCLWKYPPAATLGVFWCPCAVSFASWGLNTSTPILYYGKDPRAGISQSHTGRQLISAAPKNGHPCPKPEIEWRWLVNKVCMPGETVIDPFMGSGTTLRAAKDLGLKAIGIELEEKYCEIAAKRLEQEVFNFEASA